MKPLRLAMGALFAVSMLLSSGPKGLAEDVNVLYADGARFFDAKDFRAAAEKLRQFCTSAKNDPRVPEAKLKLGDSLLGLGMLIQATSTYEEWLRDFGTAKEAPQVRIKYARCFEAIGEWAKAIAEYKQYLVSNPAAPDSADIRLYVAAIYRDLLDQPKDAIREYDDILNRYPDFPKKLDLKLQLAEIHRRDRAGAGVSKARELYAAIAKEFPNSPEAKQALATAAWLSEDGGLKDYSAAMLAYREYAQLYAQDPEIHRTYWRMGVLCRDQLGQPTNAVDWFDKALKLKPHAALMWERAMALANTDNKEGVIKALQDIIQQHPDSAQAIEAYNKLWRRQAEWGKADQASAILQEAVTKYPNHIPFHYELGHLRRELSQWDQAIAAYQKVAAIEPGYADGEIYDLLTECYIQKKDYAGAEKLLKDVATGFEQKSALAAKCLFNLATKVFEPQKKYDDAIAAYRDLLVRYPGESLAAPDKATAGLFSAYQNKNDVPGAIAEIEKIAQQHPDTLNIRLAQAEVVRRLRDAGQPDKAIEYADKMISNDDADAAAAMATLHKAESYAARRQQTGKADETRKFLLEELQTLTKLARYYEHPRAATVRGQLEQVRTEVLPIKKDEALYAMTPLTEWSMKAIPTAEAEPLQTFGDHAKDAPWLLGKVDGWEKTATGKDLGNIQDFVALVTQFDASGEAAKKTEGQDAGPAGAPKYFLRFQGVGGNCFVFADGMLIGQNRKPGQFQFKFESGKAKGEKITVALLIGGGQSPSGVTKPVHAMAPRPLAGEDILLAGLGYHLAESYQDALNLYNQYLVKNTEPGSETSELREQVKALQNRVHAAKKDLEALAGNAPAKPDLEYQMLVAELYQADGKRDRALQAYEKAAKEFPNSRGVAVTLARAYESNGRPRDAVNSWLSILERWPNVGNIESYRRYVVWYAATQARDVDEARKRAREFNQPPSPYWTRTLGDLYFDYQPRDTQQAMLAYNDAYSKDKNDWHVASRMFDCCVADKNIPRAIQFAQFWAKDHPGHSKTASMILRIGQAFQAVGNLPDALKYYEQTQNDYPYSPEATEAVRQAIGLQGQDGMKLLEKWVKTHPGNPTAAEMYWTLVQKYEAEKAPDKMIPLCRTIWSDFRDKEPENYRAASKLASLLYGAEDAAKKSDGIALYKDLLARFGQLRVPEIRTAWVNLGTHYRKTDPDRFVAHNQQLAAMFPGDTESLDAQMSIVAYLQEQGKPLDAAIQVQRIIQGMPKHNVGWWDRIVEVGMARVNDKRYGEAAVLLKSLLRRNEGFRDKKKVQDVEQVMADALSRSGAIVDTVDPKLPEAPILWGNIFANAGEEELAWIKFKESEEVFAKFQHIVSPAYVQVIVNRLLGDKKVRDAIAICRRFMIANANATHLKDSDKAKVQLLLGDAYFRDERFDIARDEYTTAITMWPNTREAVEAQFKVGETLMAQKIFGKAEEIFNDLSTYKDEEISAKGHLMLGILFHTEGEMEKAEEKFKEVLALMPKNETADMIMYRLGVVYQSTKKYKEALDTLRLIGAYSGESKRLVEPGAQLRIRLSDRNLQIVRGKGSVPILVQTSSGDQERILLSRSFAGPGLFIATIDTELGAPKPGDKKLQVMGKDVITYDYTPEFKKDVIVQEMTEKPTITVAADAELKFSAAEIKEEEQQTVDANLFGRQQPQRRAFRTGEELAPGNFCYIQVEDGDRDISNDRDKIAVTVDAASGDQVTATVEETQPHSGIFRGAVKTGLKPADAIASDAAEGHDARHAIDEKNESDSAWISRMDGRTPKWLLVDMKDLKTIDRIEWNRGKGFKEGDERNLVRYTVEVARKKDEWFPVAACPSSAAQLRSITVVDNPDAERTPVYQMPRMTQRPIIADDDARSVWTGVVKTDPKASWTVDLDLGQICTLDRFLLKDGDPRFAVRNYQLFTEAKPGLKPIGEKDWVRRYEPAGNPKNWTFIERVRGRYLRLQITKTEGNHPEISDIEVHARLEFKSEEAKEGLGTIFTFEQPLDARFVRFFIEEYRGDAPAIGYVSISGGETKHIPAPGVDVHALATNDILEVSPGDQITASYSDEVNIDPGSPKVYREDLSVTYFNGEVACIRHEFIEDATGNRRREELEVARVNVNEEDKRIIVQITDYDEDRTDGIDKVPFMVTSRSTGQQLKLQATETEPFSGVFTKEVDLTMKGGEGVPVPQGTLRVVDGDIIQIGYIDAENTDPGNRTERTTEIEETKPAEGSIEVISTLGVLNTGKDQKPVVLIAMDEPLQIRVVDRDQALDSGSTVTVDLETSPGGVTSKVTCEVDDLRNGIFLGSIKLALGDKTSPSEVVEAAGFESEFADKAGAQDKKKDMPTVPVLNVMGRDVIAATYVDRYNPGSPTKVLQQATARVITNGTNGLFDDAYEKPAEFAHLGDRMFIKVEDGDADMTEERDTVPVLLSSSVGDTLKTVLTETLSHSGIFTAAIPLVPAPKASPEDEKPKADPNNGDFEADFGDEVKVVYVDVLNLERDRAGQPVGPTQRVAICTVVAGTDGELTAFGKKYPTEDMAVETQFHIGECYYYLGKEHIELKNKALGLKELNEGQEILRELMLHYPGNKAVDQAAYLLANLAQEQEKYFDAIEVYERIVLDWPKSPIAPDAQYKVGICWEKMDEMEKATEDYVRLAYKYPDSPLVGDAMIRIGLYFFDKKNYGVATEVFKKFVEKYPDHPSVQKVAFKQGLCYILSEKYADAGEHFKDFVEKFSDSDLKPAALYWAGDAYLKANNALKAYQMFKRVIWDYPEEKWAKYARGRLTAPVFDRIAEQE